MSAWKDFAYFLREYAIGQAIGAVVIAVVVISIIVLPRLGSYYWDALSAQEIYCDPCDVP